MKKTDLIKFRCTPAFKAALQREAAYRQITLTELIEQQLGLLGGEPVKWPVKPIESVLDADDLAILAEDALSPKNKPSPLQSPADSSEGLREAPVASQGHCRHDRPTAMCWECS